MTNKLCVGCLIYLRDMFIVGGTPCEDDGAPPIMSALNYAIKLINSTERPQSEWIPVGERLPDNETEVLFQYGQSMMVGYYVHDFTVYPPEFADENETGWYDNKDNFICGSDEVIAWQPLPEPYKNGGAE